MNSFQKSAGALGLCAVTVVALVSCGGGSSSSDGAKAECKPGVISGFQGGFTDQTVQVPPRAPDQPNSNTPIASADGGGGGEGSGGSMGQFLIHPT
jgi:hypothetical protein